MRLRNMTNVDQIRAANFVLAQLEAAIPADAPKVPAVHLARIESSSTVLLEWIFPTCRLFFNIEIDPAESGWGFVTRSGEMTWGSFESADYQALVQKSLNSI